MKTKILSIVTIFLMSLPGYAAWSLPEKELEDLEKTMKSSEKYVAIQNSKIDSLRQILSERRMPASKRADLMLRIAKIYRPSMTDSSLHYASEASKLSPRLDEGRRLRIALAMTDALSASGLFSTAIHKYDSLKSLPKTQYEKIQYFKTGRRLYANLLGYVEGNAKLSERYEELYAACDDSLIRLIPDGDHFKRFIANERLVSRGKFDQARVGLESLIKDLGKGDNIYGMANFQLAKVFKNEGNLTGYAACLALAAESDIIGNVREGFALPALAAWLYEQGEFSTAFRYINFALEDAYRGNARVRMVSMSRWLPKIDEAYRRQISGSRNEFRLYAIFTSLLLIALGVLTFFLVKEVKKSRAAHRELSSSSRLKDSYIGNFIGLCSTYSEKYYSLLRLVDRKISSGQASELLKAVKSGKIDEGESEAFFKEIDSVVLTLYPDFVDKLNLLLKPEEQVSIVDGQLTPEIRIYAFVRLGVSESAKIAKILGYSVNTVYAYRNRMRNRAISRDTFENDVLGIE